MPLRLIRAISLVFAMCLSWHAAPVHAQAQMPADAEQSGLNMAEWEVEATRAENLIEAGRASTAFFENLRSGLVGWRAAFLVAQGTNAERIATIEAQIEALGPVPEDGVEPAQLADRRARLTEQLAIAQLPRVTATEAFNRADGLIGEIDTILADRQAQELLRLDPTPLNPLNWTAALGAIGDVAREIDRDSRERIGRDDLMAGARDNAGGIALFSLVGLILILRGRTWVLAIADRILSRSGSRRGRVALAYIVSLGQFLLPAAGVLMVMIALSLTGIAGTELTELVLAALALVLGIIFARWLGGRLFPVDETRPATLNAQQDHRRPARNAIWLIGLFMGLSALAEVFAGFDQVPPAVRGVLVLPVYLGLAWGYWSLSKVLAAIRANAEEGAGGGFALGIAGFVASALVVVAVVGPILAAIGFLNAAETLMIPTALSLGILGIALSLQPVIRDLYALIFRRDEEAAAEALTPVLVNFVLALAVMPLIALIWGMRPERIGELYARFLEGFSFGGVQITPWTILAVVLVFAGGILLTRLLQGALKTAVLPRTRMDVGARNAVTAGVGYVGIALAAIIAVTSAGIDLTALGFVLGALSVGIGFGLQNVVSNFVSGIILLIERPISEGDWIEVNGSMGIVKDISVRSTRIETFDRTDLIVPNADFISGTVTNWTRGNDIGRAIVPVGVAYGTDTRRVSEILLEIAHSHPLIASFPEPAVDFIGFGADSLDFRIRAILRDVNQILDVKTELNHKIAERFTEEGIEIPFAQRDIWLRNPEALRETPKPAVAAPDDEGKT